MVALIQSRSLNSLKLTFKACQLNENKVSICQLKSELFIQKKAPEKGTFYE